MQIILLNETNTLIDAFDPPRGVTALVGGGGKSTLMLRLANELFCAGARVIVTTTTHIFPPEGIPFLSGDDITALRRTIETKRLVCIGRINENGKCSAPDIPVVKMAELADYVLIEADGAKRLPLKAPAAHEPVIPPETKLVIAIAGLSGLCKPIAETAFRPALYAALVNKNVAQPVTTRDLALVLGHESGQKKGVLPGMRFAVCLNQADDENKKQAGLDAARYLQNSGAERVVIAALEYLTGGEGKRG